MAYTLKANSQLREEMRAAKVVLWQIADEMGTTEGTLCKKLRHELPESEKESILAAIGRIRTTQAI